MVHINAYDSRVANELKIQFKHTKKRELTIDFAQKIPFGQAEPRKFDLEATIKIAEFINSNSEKMNKVIINFAPYKGLCTTNDYAAASFLVQAIQNRELKIEMRLGLNPTNKVAEVFLRTAGRFIMSIDFTTHYKYELPSDGYDEAPQTNTCKGEVATAIANLPKLRELTFNTLGPPPVGSQFIPSVLLECVSQNKLHLEKLVIYGNGMDGIDTYLQSDCGAHLKELELYTTGFQPEALLVLTNGLRQNSSISHFTLDLWQPRNDDDDEFEGISILLDTLQSKTNMKGLCLGGFDQDEASPALKELLLANQSLESLKLKLGETGSFNQVLIPNLTHGFHTNTGVKAVELEVALPDEQDAEPDVFLDLSSLIHELSEKNAPDQLHHMSIKMMQNAITETSWCSLAQFLKCPQSQLKSLCLQIIRGTTDSICSVIQSMKRSPLLEKVDLKMNWLDNDTAEDFIAADFTRVYTDVLGEATAAPMLTAVSVEFGDLPWLEVFSAEEKKDMEEAVLEAMKANTQLEKVRLGPVGNREFDRTINSYSTRNKGTKAAANILDGWDIATIRSTVPGIMSDIEDDCQELNAPTDIHFVNIWYALIHKIIQGNPWDVAKYCPDKDEDNLDGMVP